MSTHAKTPIGIVLMTYGSATTSKDVSTFLHHVYPNPSDELIAEFERRFDVITRSPLIDITLAQASALSSELDRRHPGKYLVEPGFLHSRPFIEDAVAKLHDRGASPLRGLLLSPQYSPHIMRGYDQALELAAREHGYLPGEIAILGPWASEPNFIKLMSGRLVSARTKLARQYESPIPIVFTTHSLPEAVVRRDPSYLEQLKATIQAIAASADLTAGEWHSGYQSAGHTPEPWLKPDLNDIIADLHAGKAPAVLVVPIQFVADHLETLFDLDVAAREETEAGGVNYHRLEAPGTDPLFIAALANVATRN